jgi:uncharacterized protein
MMLGYKPFGIPAGALESITLLLEEFEAIRLLDHEGMTQEQAAVCMEISRPTLTRIYEKARKTVADAFVEGKMIIIEGGHVRFGKQWFRCTRCYKLIQGLDDHTKCKDCNAFSVSELQPLNNE